MAYVRSVREIPLDEEPIASALEAVLPDPDESPYTGELRWDNVTENQRRLLETHPGAAAIVGLSGPGQVAPPQEGEVG